MCLYVRVFYARLYRTVCGVAVANYMNTIWTKRKPPTPQSPRHYVFFSGLFTEIRLLSVPLNGISAVTKGLSKVI